MPVEKLPAGTRGSRQPPGWLGRIFTPIMIRVHRRKGDRFQGMDLLYLTTVGAKSGEPRTTPMARFDDGRGGWIVVASAGGTARHPAWYHNIAAHPDQVRVELAGRKVAVSAEQLHGQAREQAWGRIKNELPRFAKYEQQTDREIPVIRLQARA